MAEVIIRPSSKPVDSYEEIQGILNTVGNDSVVNFDAGEFWTSRPLRFPENLKGLVLNFNGGTLNKMSNFSGGSSLLTLRRCEGGIIKGGFLNGKTISVPATPAWGDDGLYLASCKNILVENLTLSHFGDAAWRIATAMDDTARINSNSIYVKHCAVIASHQATTTSNAPVNTDFYLNGGTSNYRIDNCSFIKMRGSLKIASRSPAFNVRIEDCHFEESTDKGIEVVGVSGVIATNNSFRDIVNGPIVVYNDASRGVPGYPISDIIFMQNSVQRCGYARFGNAKWADGYQTPTRHFGLAWNEFTEPLRPERAPFVFADGPFENVYAQFNKASGFTGRNILASINNASMVNVFTEQNEFSV